MGEPEKKESFQEKITHKMDEIKNSDNMKQLCGFAKTNLRDTVGFIALILGILTLFFSQFWGGLIIGVVGGLYFADPILYWIRHFKACIETDGIVKCAILLGVALGFLIVAPAFFLGAAAAVGIRFILSSES